MRRIETVDIANPDAHIRPTCRETKLSLDEGELDPVREVQNQSQVLWLPRGLPPMPPRNKRLNLPRYEWVAGGLKLGSQGAGSPSFISFTSVLPTLPSELAPEQARWAYAEDEHYVPPPRSSVASRARVDAAETITEAGLLAAQQADPRGQQNGKWFGGNGGPTTGGRFGIHVLG